jgi:hypothetical protein
MVQEELIRYLAGSPADLPLMLRLSHLRSTDQSWCVLSPTVFNREIVRRTLAALDPKIGQPDHVDGGLIMGIHFDKGVVIEYEIVPNSAHSEDRLQTEPRDSPTLQPDMSPLASHFFRTSSFNFHKVIRLSKRQYEQFIAQERALELAHRAR